MKALVYQPSTFRWVAAKTVGGFWPGVYWSRLSGLSYRDVPIPALPNSEWVGLRTALGGICGTDLAVILQKNHPASYLQGLTSFPIVLGHENVAVIDEVGSAVGGWRVGQRVCVEPSLSCYSRSISSPCRNCRDGFFALCENQAGGALPAGTMIGLNAFSGGSWSPYFVAHQSQLHLVPPEISDEQAILTDPLACALHGVLRSPVQDGDRVLIVGGGIIGLGVAGCLKALGRRAEITAVVRHGYQEEWMNRLGANHIFRLSRRESARRQLDILARHVGGKRIDGKFGNYGFLGGFDVVFDCVGTGRSIGQSMKLTRARGVTVLLGTGSITLLDITPAWSKELNVIGAYGRQIEHHRGRRIHTYELLFELLLTKKLDTAGMLTHTFALRDYRAAFRALTTRNRHPVIKAAFRHDS